MPLREMGSFAAGVLSSCQWCHGGTSWVRPARIVGLWHVGRDAVSNLFVARYLVSYVRLKV